MEQPKPYGRFDFDLAAAVMDQLIAAFDTLTIGPLIKPVIDEIDAEQGVYLLYIGTRLMYVGKAVMPLPTRLEQHRWNLSGRNNINMMELGFKGLIIHKNWGPSVHEKILISHYRGQGDSQWNKTGLGNHDPGHNREDTITEDDHFDMLYPIKEDFVPEGVTAGEWNAREMLKTMKQALPFIFRYECDDPKRHGSGSIKYNDITISVPRAGMTLKELLNLIVAGFPETWQATFFPGRVIFYEERRNYAHATDVIRK
ncbi:MAG: hypothetical protein AABP62_21260 [Planctomycetota bacterium]